MVNLFGQRTSRVRLVKYIADLDVHRVRFVKYIADLDAFIAKNKKSTRAGDGVMRTEDCEHKSVRKAENLAPKSESSTKPTKSKPVKYKLYFYRPEFITNPASVMLHQQLKRKETQARLKKKQVEVIEEAEEDNEKLRKVVQEWSFRIMETPFLILNILKPKGKEQTIGVVEGFSTEMDNEGWDNEDFAGYDRREELKTKLFSGEFPREQFPKKLPELEKTDGQFDVLQWIESCITEFQNNPNRTIY